MITFIRIKPVKIDSEGRTVANMHIAVASASELPTKYSLDGMVVHEASKAWDVSTGTQYGFLDNGGWVAQPGGGGASGNIVQIKGTVASVNQLPNNAEPGWLYFVKPLGATESDEYVYTEAGEWDKIGSTSISITVDSALSTESENPVQNKVVTNALNGKQATLVVGTNLDNAPASGSDNPITSGAVYTVVGNINSVLEGVL